MSALFDTQPGSEITAPANDVKLNRSDASVARKHVLTGYLIISLFLGASAGWAALVPFSSAAIAPGVVGKDGYRKTVQHLEGGIIRAILVKDGDRVASGQSLIELNDIRARSDYELLQKQKMIAAAKEACLRAEQNGQSEIKLPEWLDLESADPAVRDAIEGHLEASRIRRRLHNEQIAIIDQRIVQAETKIQALDKERSVLAKKSNLIRQELNEYNDFEQKGLVTRRHTFDLKRQKVATEAERSANRVLVESTKQEITALEMQKSELIASYAEHIVEELDKVREQLVDLEEKGSKSGDTLERTVIRAPIDGVVVNLQINTVGGVITPGQPLLDIVPSSGNLMVEARIHPRDRDTVRTGQDAEVRFSAFNQRLTSPVRGKVVLISADSLMDSLTKEPYYQARVELLESPEEQLNGAPVFPGMQAEVLIITGERTALSYFLNPILKSFNRSFREE